MQIVFKSIGIACAAAAGVALGGCASSTSDLYGGPVAVELLGVASVSPTHPMTGNPIGGFSGIEYDPVAEAWLVVSNRQPGPIAYTLRTSFDPRAESDGDAWVAGEFQAWLGREWAVPAGGEDAEAVALRRGPDGGRQRVWAFERDPAITISDVRGDSVRSLELPQDAIDHYAFDQAIKGLAVVPDRAGEELWGAMSGPLSIDKTDAPGLTRVLRWRLWYEEPVATSFYAPDQYGTDGQQLASVVGLSTIAGADWRDNLPVFAIERADGPNPAARLFLLVGQEARDDLEFPLITKRAIGTVSDLVGGPFGSASGLAVGPEIADLRGGRLVLVTVNDGFAPGGKAQRVYALRVQTTPQ